MKKALLLIPIIIYISCTNNETNINITVTTNPITEIARTTVTSGGEISNDSDFEITSKGVCWNTTGNPTITDVNTNDGTGNIEFVSYLTGLNPNSSYYLRAYIKYEDGIIYGNERQFTTLDDGTIASINTLEVSNIMQTIAICGGEIIDDGDNEITEKGICWSTNSTPTIYNSNTNEGMGNENFSSHMTNLSRNTTYYVRAYAINSKGIAYGSQRQFTTQDVYILETVEVLGGTFTMGNNNSINFNQQPEHEVTVSSFRMSKYEITNAQYVIFLNEINADADGYFEGIEYIRMDFSEQINYVNNEFVVDDVIENYPVVYITWDGANAFATYYGGRLPTEAEWEFASKGGVNSNNYIFSGSNNPNDVAWHYVNSMNPDNEMIGDRGTHIVGTKQANELGLYDMSGNVCEWVSDYFDPDYYSISPSTNPQGPSSGVYGIVRGGGWYDSSTSYLEVTDRQNEGHDIVNYNNGFRPVFQL